MVRCTLQSSLVTLLLASVNSLAAQHVVVPVPSAAQVRLTPDSFTTPDGVRRQFDVYRPLASGAVPVVVFVNVVGPMLRSWDGYVEWGRLVTSRGLAGVTYEMAGLDPALDIDANRRIAMASLDSLLAALRRSAGRHDVDPDRLVLWAASANTTTGTPAALDPTRPAVRGYILYYGSGEVAAPRLDVPVLIARAGLDAVRLNANLDALAQQLVRAGVALTLINLPAGQHGFDLLDSTAVSASAIEQTLDFAVRVTRDPIQAALRAGETEARAGVAFAAGRWADAVAGYERVTAERPTDAGAHWRLGLARLEVSQNAAALQAFNRARDLGQGGARDIGLPAARAAIRSGDTAAARGWVRWALERYALIRDEIARDDELAALLPAVGAP